MVSVLLFTMPLFLLGHLFKSSRMILLVLLRHWLTIRLPTN